jgi:hypothetical protein
MRLLTGEWQKPNNSLRVLEYLRQKKAEESFMGWRSWWDPSTWFSGGAASPPPLSPHSDSVLVPEDYAPIVSMLAVVKSMIFDTVKPPLKYRSVYLSIPDIPNAGWRYNGHISILCDLAGLEMLGGSYASLHALHYHGVKHWFGPGDEPPPHIDFFYPRNMLVISYNTASLTISLCTRHLGVIDPGRTTQSALHGADNMGAMVGYWDGVQSLISDVIRKTLVDYVLVMGSHAREARLLRVLQDIVADHVNINASVLERYVQGPASKEEREADLFAAAGQAAVSARWGMQTGYIDCIAADDCPVDDEDVFGDENWWEILGVLEDGVMIQ